MKTESILKQHGICYHVNAKGHIFALDYIDAAKQPIYLNVTNHSLKQLKRFLGY